MLFAFFEHSGKGPIDRAIVEIATAVGHAERAPTPYSHHGGYLRVWRDDDGLVHREGIESVPLRTRRFLADEKCGHHMRVYRVGDATPEQEAIAWALAGAAVGHWYNLLAIWQAYHYCKTGKPLVFLLDPRMGVDCVEGMADWTRGAGLPFCGLRPSSSITPPLAETHAEDYWELTTLHEVLTCAV